MTSRRHAILAETVATALLLVAVVGSGIMAERLAPTNPALALLANSIATGCALVALIVTFAPLSGAHMNPLVSIALALRGDHAWRDVPGYSSVRSSARSPASSRRTRCSACRSSRRPQKRARAPRSCSRKRSRRSVSSSSCCAAARLAPIRFPGPSACYITAAYWFTASTSFANPAVTIARALTDSFAGISPIDVPGFVLGQCAGATAAVWFDRVVSPPEPTR